MNSKQLSIALAVIVVILLAVAGYVALRDNSQTDTSSQQNATLPKPTNNNPVSTNETANWKTYTSNGFEFSYPPDFKGEEVLQGSRGEIWARMENKALTKEDYQSIGGGDPEQILVAGKRAYKIFSGDAGCEGTLVGIEYNSKQIVHIQFTACEEQLKNNPISQDEVTINKILSTLKFTK
jgi:hypothetical protein